MSDLGAQNIELVRRFNESWDVGLFRKLYDGKATEEETARVHDQWKGMLEQLDPDVEIDMSFMPGGGARRGIDGWIAFWREWIGTWEDWRFTQSSWEAIGKHVLVEDHLEARGRDGVDVDAHQWEVWTVHNGKIARLAVYLDREEALAATVREQGPSP
jgi:ketosteroid isomerase-like protein